MNHLLQHLALVGAAVGFPLLASAQPGTVAWAFDQGAASSTAAAVSVDNMVSVSSYTLGSLLKNAGTANAGTEIMTKLQPTEALGKTSAVPQAFVEFAFSPKRGVTFAPRKLTFNAAKLGTSAGFIDTYAIAGTDTLKLTSAFNPYRPNDKDDTTPEYSAQEYDLSAMATTGDGVKIVFYIYNLAANKQVGLSDITVYGDFAGAPEEVASYTLSVAQPGQGEGTVTVNPVGASFDEGTVVGLTASENFGYHFAGWVDDNGKTVSTENPYTFAIGANTHLTATYTKNNVYALNLTLTDGACGNLVEVQPEGHVVDGVRHYEEGTVVRLSAHNNKVLTFTGWEDNTTNAERTIEMTADHNLTARFSAADYIVGWDLYEDAPSSERAADYKADTENGGLLRLRNAAGTTTSWLACGHGKGAQNGRYGARVWRPLKDQNYFEIMFSTKGYHNVRVSNALGDDYNAYSVMTAQYSTDGTNFTEVARFALPNRGWDEREFALPADASDRDKVYVRWVADSTAAMTGVANDYDGTTIGDIFVLADAASASDTTAPVLVSSNPSDGGTGVSASGSIVLSFDEKVKLGSGDAMLGSEVLQPIVSGKTVVYKYSNLAYGTTYDFGVPAGAVTDRNGNAFGGVQLSFTTMERTQPKARLYDAVVAADGTGDYTTVQAAIDAAPENSITPWLIFVKKGVYTGHHVIKRGKNNISIIGQGKHLVQIADGRRSGGENAYGINDGATMDVEADNVFLEGIDLINSWGVEQNNGPQALALASNGDKLVMNRMGLRSYQDTWYTGGNVEHRSFVTNSWIEGAVDFFYGKGDVMVAEDTINIVRRSGGYIVAPNHTVNAKWGYVFLNTVITAPGVPSETDVWLGRPWHENPKTVFINTKSEVTIPATGWYPTMGGLPALWAEYNTMDGEGNPLDLSHRRVDYYYKNGTDTVRGKSATAVLSAEESAQYTIKNVCGGDDAWNPQLVCAACEAPVVTLQESKLSWAPVPYAICYVVTRGTDVIGFTTETSYGVGAAPGAAAEYQVQAVGEYGALGKYGVATETTGIHTAGMQSSAPVAVEYFSIDGKKQSGLLPGINIVRTVGADGRVDIRKVTK